MGYNVDDLFNDAIAPAFIEQPPKDWEEFCHWFNRVSARAEGTRKHEVFRRYLLDVVLEEEPNPLDALVRVAILLDIDTENLNITYKAC